MAFVEKDSMMYASEMQRNAPWGLSRISHRTELTLRTFNKYEHDENGGEGVKVFVIDTGINVDHRDFHGRASWGATFAKDGDNDGNGHGSHCAGTIAGQRFGVAKQANPVAVKVLSAQGSGSNSEVLAGINWAVEQHQIDAADAKKNGRKYKGAVANMSLGGGKSQALDRAVNNAVDEGLIFSVAAVCVFLFFLFNPPSTYIFFLWNFFFFVGNNHEFFYFILFYLRCLFIREMITVTHVNTPPLRLLMLLLSAPPTYVMNALTSQITVNVSMFSHQVKTSCLSGIQVLIAPILFLVIIDLFG